MRRAKRIFPTQANGRPAVEKLSVKRGKLYNNLTMKADELKCDGCALRTGWVVPPA